MAIRGSFGPRFPALVLAGLLGFTGSIPFVSEGAFAQASAQAPGGPSVPAADGNSAGTIVPVVTGARLATKGGRTRLIFRISGPTAARAYVLARPDRVVVDLPEVNFQIDPEVGRPAADRKGDRRVHSRRSPARVLGGVVGSFRFGLFAPGKSRIVVDLIRPARVVRAAMAQSATGAPTFVLELAPTDAASFRIAAAAAVEPLVAEPSVAVAAVKPGGRPLVMLDPGHGGIDTGALGPDGIEEKKITLAFAAALAAKLTADGRIKVAMTRTTDVFLPLLERVRLAQAAGASLLLSIHADRISEAARVSGATVYTLSNRASDAEAAREAKRENMADAAGGLESKQDKGEVADILFDLARRETRAYSNVFARLLVRDWRPVAPLNKNPHRSAGFMVLKSPDVPSALLELGYLSNRRDVEHLTNARWRDRTAATVARAIEAFFAGHSRSGSSQRVAGPATPDATSIASALHAE